MQPPFRLTGDPGVDWVLFVLGAVVCVYWLRALRLAREGARRFLRNLAIATLIFLLCQLLLSGTTLQPQNRILVSFVIAAVVLSARASAPRSRRIPKSIRDSVIARDLKDQRFDPKKHHIDHVWPFSKGGSHTPDNLRVTEKRANLQKGAKRPRLRDMW